MPAVVSEVVTDLVAAAEKLVADDRLITAPEMLLGDVEALLTAVTAIQATIVRRLREADAVNASVELYGRSTRKWLTEDQLLAGPEAGRLVRMMRQLPLHPATEAAFESRRISATHVSAILTALTHVPPRVEETVEQALLDRAVDFPPEELAGFIDELLQGLGVTKESEEARERRYSERGVDVAATLHGSGSLSGTLTPEIGAKLQAAFAVAAQPSGADDLRTLRQRRHDALGVLADSYLAQQAPSFTGAPRTVIVTMDLDVLEGRLRDALITLPGGATISADTARRLACDAELIPAVLGGRGDVLDIGVADHEFTAPIRRGAYLRDDGRCVFHRCSNPPVELHHIHFRRHHGPTNLDNAAWLCAFHHWLAHEGGWALSRAPDGGYLWTRPDGHTLHRPLGRHTTRHP